jgi:hypothetical protein
VEAIKVLREAFTNHLRGTIAHNLPHYRRDRPWLAEVAGGPVWEFETNLVPAQPLELLEPDGDDLKDIENAIRMHKALPSLTPVNARDPRLWTRLTHVELWGYMRLRWPIERHLADKGRAARFVESRYFVARNESRALLRNGAARLWWSAKVSHDPSRDNPYELTSVLLSSLDITQQILERNLGRAPAVLHGFLEFLRIQGDKLLSGGDKNRERIRRLAKFLNLRGGVTVLDCLSESEVVAMLYHEDANISALTG